MIVGDGARTMAIVISVRYRCDLISSEQNCRWSVGASKTNLLSKTGGKNPFSLESLIHRKYPQSKRLQLLSPPQLPALPFSNLDDAEKKSVGFRGSE